MQNAGTFFLDSKGGYKGRLEFAFAMTFPVRVAPAQLLLPLERPEVPAALLRAPRVP